MTVVLITKQSSICWGSQTADGHVIPFFYAYCTTSGGVVKHEKLTILTQCGFYVNITMPREGRVSQNVQLAVLALGRLLKRRWQPCALLYISVILQLRSLWRKAETATRQSDGFLNLWFWQIIKLVEGHKPLTVMWYPFLCLLYHIRRRCQARKAYNLDTTRLIC